MSAQRINAEVSQARCTGEFDGCPRHAPGDYTRDRAKHRSAYSNGVTSARHDTTARPGDECPACTPSTYAERHARHRRF